MRNGLADLSGGNGFKYWLGSFVIDDEGDEHLATRDFFGFALASFIVTQVSDGRRASLILFDGDRVRLAGTVVIPLDRDLPSQGSVVICGYMRASRESGCIQNPVYLGKSDSIRAAECITGQLKFSAEMETQRLV